MKSKSSELVRQRRRRHGHIRKKIRGTGEVPRVAVRRSLNHIYAQVIDDLTGKTLAAVSTQSAAVKDAVKSEKLNKCQVSEKVGEVLAGLAKGKGVRKVVFDRGGYLYHGRVKALAEGARKGGLVF